MSLWGVWKESDLEIGQQCGMRKQALHVYTLLKGRLLGHGQLASYPLPSRGHVSLPPLSQICIFRTMVTGCTFSPFILFLFTVRMSLKLSVYGM